MVREASQLGTRGRWSWILAIALALFIVPKVAAEYTPYTWLVGDGGFYLNIQKSLTRHGTIDQSKVHPHSWYEGSAPIDDAFSNVSLGQAGQWWPKHSYVMPIAALPFYWLFGVPGTLVFNVLMMIGMLVLGYHLAREVAPDGHSAVAAVVCGLAGPFVMYSYNFSNDGFYTVLCLGGLLAAARKRPVLAGLLFGLSIWAKVTCVLVGPAYLGVMVWRRYDRNGVIRLVAASAIPVLGLALANTWMFGAPWITSYHRVLVVREGALTVASHTDLFTVPFWTGLRLMFSAHRHGLATAWPASLLACLGLLPMLLDRRRGLALGMLLTSVALFSFYAKFAYYQERFLFPWFVLGIVPGAVLLESAGNRLSSLRVPPGMRLGLAAGVIGVIGAVRIVGSVTQAEQHSLPGHIEDAEVFLGDRHCDYFNNMRWAWECIGADRGDLDFVGVNDGQVHTFEGTAVTGMIFVGGHSSRRPRRIVFRNVPLRDALRVKYGLDDQSKEPAGTEVRFRIAGERIWRHKLEEVGILYEKALDTSRWAGSKADVEVVIRTRHRRNSRLVFDGQVE
ncbi:MAG: hypothetical protein ACI9WU_003086 [Myxococcota bacterium]|jgi:hypothetical protein